MQGNGEVTGNSRTKRLLVCMPVYTDPPPSRGWFLPVLLGWTSLLAILAVAVWLGFASFDAFMAQQVSGAAVMQ